MKKSTKPASSSLNGAIVVIGPVGINQYLLSSKMLFSGDQVQELGVLGYSGYNVGLGLADGLKDYRIIVHCPLGGDVDIAKITEYMESRGVILFPEIMSERRSPRRYIITAPNGHITLTNANSVIECWEPLAAVFNGLPENYVKAVVFAGDLNADTNGSYICRLIEAAARDKIPVVWLPGRMTARVGITVFKEVLRYVSIFVINRQDAIRFLRTERTVPTPMLTSMLSGYCSQDAWIAVTTECGGTNVINKRIVYSIPPTTLMNPILNINADDAFLSGITSAWIKRLNPIDLLEMARDKTYESYRVLIESPIGISLGIKSNNSGMVKPVITKCYLDGDYKWAA